MARDQTFTVVGYYPDNHQPFAFHVQCEAALEAVRAAMQQVDADLDTTVVAVFPGHLTCALDLGMTVLTGGNADPGALRLL